MNRRWTWRGSSISSTTAAQLDRVVRAIEDYLAEPISTAWLARHVAISATHLKRLFAATFGMPIHAYVMQRRVEHARRLLAGDTHSLAEVAIAAGFAHQSHMARWLRRVHGTTPRAARHTAGWYGSTPYSHRARPTSPQP